MSDNLIMTERLMKAALCLNEAEQLVKVEGQWENLERLNGWSPEHTVSKLERQRDKARRERDAKEMLLSLSLSHRDLLTDERDKAEQDRDKWREIAEGLARGLQRIESSESTGNIYLDVRCMRGIAREALRRPEEARG